MNNSIINKIQDVKDAIKNSEKILTGYLQQIQDLQNQRIYNQKKMAELEKMISDLKIQKELIKKKNSIIQTNIDHIQSKEINVDDLRVSYENSLDSKHQIQEKHQQIQDQIIKIKSQYNENPEKLNSIILDFEQIQIEKQKLSNQFSELQNYPNNYLEMSNKYTNLEKQEETLQQQLTEFKSISENQENQIKMLKYENEKYKESISQSQKESVTLAKSIKDIEDQLFSTQNDICLSQITEEFVGQIQDQILLTDDQINLLKIQQNTIEESLTINCEDHEYLNSIDTDELREKADKMEKELNDDKNTLFLLLRERDELLNEEEKMKCCTIENQKKLSYLNKLREQLQKMENRDPIYHKEISELRSKSEKLENDLNFLEKCMMRKKFEQEEYEKRIKNEEELKAQHESIMEQIQSRFKPDEIKVDKEKIDSLHKENKTLMQKILKFADLLGPEKVKKKKVIKKKPFIP